MFNVFFHIVAIRFVDVLTRKTKAQVIFEEAQQIIESMKFPKALKEAMHQAMTEVGQKDGEERLTKLLPNCTFSC